MYKATEVYIQNTFATYFTFDYIINGVTNVDRNKLQKVFKLVKQKIKCDSFFSKLKKLY